MQRAKYFRVPEADFEEPLVQRAAEEKKHSRCWWQAASCAAVIILLILFVLVIQNKSGHTFTRHQTNWQRHSVTANVRAASAPSKPIQAKEALQHEERSMVDIVKQAGKIKERKERMEMLNRLKLSHCGGYHLDTKSTNWELVHAPDEVTYFDSTKDMREKKISLTPNSTYQRKVCHVQHPHRPGVTVSIERAGPFLGNGGYDWRSFVFLDVAQLSKVTRGKVVYVVGGMYAPVDGEGNILGHPPLHVHHAHLYPYGSEEEVGRKIRHTADDVSLDHHDVLLQTHGDSECAEAEGGVACLLTELPPGQGFRIIDSHGGFFADSTVNDVREKKGPGSPLEYYVEHVVFHTTNEQKAVTFFTLCNPTIPAIGPATYALPVDESSTLMYYRFSNSHWGSGGTVTEFIFHTHQTFFDSMWLFKGNTAYDELEAFRGGKYLPMILECHGYDLAHTKSTLYKRLSKVAQPVCIVAHPNLQYTCNSPDQCGRYDKRLNFRCVNTSVSLAEGEVLTMVAFNKAKRIPGRSWRESREIWRSRTNPYSDHFAAFQHSVFRAVFVPDRPATLATYVPPAYFNYAVVAKDANPDIQEKHPSLAFKKLERNCPANISFT